VIGWAWATGTGVEWNNPTMRTRGQRERVVFIRVRFESVCDGAVAPGLAADGAFCRRGWRPQRMHKFAQGHCAGTGGESQMASGRRTREQGTECPGPPQVARLTFFGARTSLSAAVSRKAAEQTRMSALQPDGTPAAGKRQMPPALRSPGPRRCIRMLWAERGRPRLQHETYAPSRLRTGRPRSVPTTSGCTGSPGWIGIGLASRPHSLQSRSAGLSERCLETRTR
jgi:hypothetical protein